MYLVRLRTKEARAIVLTRPASGPPVAQALKDSRGTLFSTGRGARPTEHRLRAAGSAAPLGSRACPRADPDTRPPAEDRLLSRSGRSLPRPLLAAPNALL